MTSGNVAETSYVRSIVNAIYAKDRNTLIIGAPLSGKTTLMMQAACKVEGFLVKMLFLDLTVTKANYIIKFIAVQRNNPRHGLTG